MSSAPSESPSSASYLSAWDKLWKGRSKDEKDISLLRVVDFINDDEEVKTLEDWGCGICICQKYFRPDISYTGVDGTKVLETVKVADLNEYKSKVDAIFMRHVLEHNPNWRQMLQNLLDSFTRKAIIMVFTPFSKEAHDTSVPSGYVGVNNKGEKVSVPDINMVRSDFEEILKKNNVSYAVKEMNTKTVYGMDTVFYLSK